MTDKIGMTKEEQLKMFMTLPKKRLAEMLVEANKQLETPAPISWPFSGTLLNQPPYSYGTVPCTGRSINGQDVFTTN